MKDEIKSDGLFSLRETVFATLHRIRSEERRASHDRLPRKKTLHFFVQCLTGRGRRRLQEISRQNAAHAKDPFLPEAREA